MNNYEKFCEEIKEIRGAEVYGELDNKPYVELAMITNENIEKAKKSIARYGYSIIDENEYDGSDYPSYCIYFE